MTDSRQFIVVLVTACLLAASAVSFAETEKETRGWQGSAELAYLLTRGNSNSDKVRARGDASREGQKWRHTAKLEAASERSKPSPADKYVRSEERYFTSYKLDWKLDDANYIFNVASGEKDHFSGFEYELTYALGYGRRLVDGDVHQLDFELGPGYRYRRFDADTLDPGQSRSDDNAIVRAALRYQWQISQTTVFREAIVSEHENDLTTTRADTSLTSKINDRFSTRITHVLRYNSETPVGVKHADNELTVGVVYTF